MGHSKTSDLYVESSDAQANLTGNQARRTQEVIRKYAYIHKRKTLTVFPFPHNVPLYGLVFLFINSEFSWIT